MIDVAWFLGGRALLDYTKATIIMLRTRLRRHELADITGQAENTITVGPVVRSMASRIAYAIMGLVIALVFGPVFVIGAYTILTSLMSQ